MTALLQLEGVSVRFGTHWALRDVHLRLQAGDFGIFVAQGGKRGIQGRRANGNAVGGIHIFDSHLIISCQRSTALSAASPCFFALVRRSISSL